jgi:hypothetical protein
MDIDFVKVIICSKYLPYGVLQLILKRQILNKVITMREFTRN